MKYGIDMYVLSLVELSRCFKSLKRAGQYCVCDQVQKVCHCCVGKL